MGRRASTLEEVAGACSRIPVRSYFVLILVVLLVPSGAHGHVPTNEVDAHPKDRHLRPQAPTSKVVLAQSHFIPSSTSGWYRLWGVAILSLFFVWSAHSHKVNANLTISCWMMASMTMNVVNKEVAVKFSATTLPVMLQMTFAMVMFTVMEWRKLKCAKLVDLAKWSVVPFFFTGMLYTSIHSLKELPLSAVLILRNVLPLFTLCGEKILYGKPTEITSTMVLSMLLALLGTTMYGSWNLTVTRSGVLLVIGNCVMTVFDRILQRHFLHDPDFSLSLPLCMVWNNFLGMIIICGLAYANGEMLLWRTMAQQASTTAWSLMLFSCICGCSLGYLGLKCQRLVSATTFLMLQNFTKVFLILIGMGYFGDSVWGISALGCTLSMCGTMWYSYDRLPVETAENSKSASTETDKLQSLSKARAGVP